MNSVMVYQWGHPWDKYYPLSRSFYIRRNNKKVNSIGVTHTLIANLLP